MKDEGRRTNAESELHPSSFILHPLIEHGLERSRVLVLCMSANAFGSDWAQLESGTFRFRDPLNRERRFLPLRLDDAPIKGSLAQFLYINWLPAEREQEYAKLLLTCKPKRNTSTAKGIRRTVLGFGANGILSYAFSSDGKHAISSGGWPHTREVVVWDIAPSSNPQILRGHEDRVTWASWSPTLRQIASGSRDKTVRVWDADSNGCIAVLTEHVAGVSCVAWHPNLPILLSGDDAGSVKLWDTEHRSLKAVFDGHSQGIEFIRWCRDGKRALTSSKDSTIRLWDVRTGECVRQFEGCRGAVHSTVRSADETLVVASDETLTLRIWDAAGGQSLFLLEGHSKPVLTLAGANRNLLLSGSADCTVRLWESNTGRCLAVLEGHVCPVVTVEWSGDGQLAYSGDQMGAVRVWNLSDLIGGGQATADTMSETSFAPDQVQYTNAKVLLVGESGAGKTGLSKRLALNDWQPSDSTVGAWATQWKLPVSGGKGVEREIWLWDFGGQADQRLIHQLYMDETALAVLVFDGQKEDLFETLGQWDRDLTRASRNEFAKLLVAGRVDAGGLRASRSEVEKFAAERKFRGFLATSAKRNLGCEELKQAILDAIPWDELPCRTTEVLFKRLKEQIIALKDEGRVLMRFNELRETLQLRLSGELARFADAELRAVLTLLAGPGVVWELAFGSWVLLQPERINAYAQAVIRTLQADEHQRGCLMEERVLKGDLVYDATMERLKDADEERFVLLAMHQTLVERGLCLRQPTDKGNLLVFPSYYRRERPDAVEFPAVLVNYRFAGFLDEIYATLVVRLHHTDAFDHAQLWRYAADFTTKRGKQLGIKLDRRGPGLGNLEVFFDKAVSTGEKILFSKYIHEHLLQHARDVERLRHYVCESCGTPVGNRDVAMSRLHEWLRGRPPGTETGGGFKLKGKNKPPTIICVSCEERVQLWDEMEQQFASPEIQQRVRDMQEEATIELSNQSKERVLVGEVISTIALANQIARELTVSDHGIDMEIEFTNDAHEATNRKLYLQLKSGDSYLRRSKKDGTETFTIKDERHARYWMASAFPVLLVIRNAEGEVRWMEVRDWLKRASENGKKPVKQIVFQGERFDVMSVRRWRERVLGIPKVHQSCRHPEASLSGD